MNLIRQIAKSILTAVASHNRLLVRGPRSANGSPKIALTFDDGPHPDLTPPLLDRLNEQGLRATFFVIGRQAEKYPELIRRIAAEGHEVANHTYSHSEPKQTATSTFLDEVRRTDEILSSITGQIPAIVRPPKGEMNWSKLRGLWRAKKTVVLWNVDPKDFRMQSTNEMNDWCENYEPVDGDIVLFHDIHPFAFHAINELASQGRFERVEAITISQWFERVNNKERQSPVVSSTGSLT